MQSTETAIEPTEQALLEAKTELTVKTIDMLMFRGPVKGMLEGLSKMVGMPSLSVAFLLPTKNKRNLRNFLLSLREILNRVLDDQVSFDSFVPDLAQYIDVIKHIAEEEK